MKAALTALWIAYGLLATGLPHAQDRSIGATELDEVVVTASPLRQGAEELMRPVGILAGTTLDDARAATLGETVSVLPGVQGSFFGPGVSRPIIRGLDGPRVQVLSEGLSTLDASTVSVDHAVTIEPFLADQIEVLKGPATLLFGAGAVGGAVNIVDGRIHEKRVDGIGGRLELRGNTVAHERAGMFRADAGAGDLAFHVDAFHRDSDDYAIPGIAEHHHHDDHDHDHSDDQDHHDSVAGRAPNTATHTRGGAVGISHVGDRGFAGVSVSRYESRYGVPGHQHGHDDHGADPGHDDDGHLPDEHGDVVIDMGQTRVDAKAGMDQPLAGHHSLRLRLAHNNYGHIERDGAETGTRFDNTGTEGRVELAHDSFAGWNGAYGLQFGHRDFRAVGDEAFVPPSQSGDLGVFLIERRAWNRLLLEIGGRLDRHEIDPDGPHSSREFDAFSASLAGEWRLSERWHLRLGLDRAQRAPGAEELYADGLHVATASYEIGDIDLGLESSNQVELGLHHHGDTFRLKAALYRNRFDDFIHLAPTGGEIDHVAVHQWRQADARFHGAEVEIDMTIADNAFGRYELRLMADTVRGRLDEGGNLPRIAPGRVGAALGWTRGRWRASLSGMHHLDQDDVAEHETPTSGYTLVDADIAWSVDIGDNEVELFAQGRNLGDAEARVHTSFLKDRAPLPGRSIGFGLRAFF